MSYLSEFQKEVHEWAKDTFLTQNVNSKILHLESEVGELKDAPEDRYEMADCFLLLLGIAEMAGVDLLQAAREKHQINRQRTWGAPDERGVVSHVKTDRNDN